jgi:hypothetical protein
VHDGDGWHRAFDDPIPLPGAGELRTLRTKLPKREHDAPDWRAAIEALMLVAEHGGDTMLWRIGIMRALTFFFCRAFIRDGRPQGPVNFRMACLDNCEHAALRSDPQT